MLSRKFQCALGGVLLYVKPGELALAVEFLRFLNFIVVPQEEVKSGKNGRQFRLGDSRSGLTVHLIERDGPSVMTEMPKPTIYLNVTDAIAVLAVLNEPENKRKFSPESDLGSGPGELVVRLDHVFYGSFVFKSTAVVLGAVPR